MAPGLPTIDEALTDWRAKQAKTQADQAVLNKLEADRALWPFRPFHATLQDVVNGAPRGR